MPTYQDLIKNYSGTASDEGQVDRLHHACMASVPENMSYLKTSVESILPQVDTLHVFLQDYESVPAFLNHEKIYISRSQDFGNLGECGKYYWVEEISGYQFICSELMKYPSHYVENMRKAVEVHDKKAIVGLGGLVIDENSFSINKAVDVFESTGRLDHTRNVDVVDDSAIAFHSSVLKISRHHFYQQEFSSYWLSILAKEQNIPLLCMKHEENWIEGLSADESLLRNKNNQLLEFIIRTFFQKDFPEKKTIPQKQSINDFFDKTYVMNLERRHDRWSKFLKRNERHKVEVTRYAASDGSEGFIKEEWMNYNKQAFITLPEGIEPIKTFRQKYLNYDHHFTRIQFMEEKLGRKVMQKGALGYAYTYISILQEAIRNNFSRILILDDDVIFHKDFNELFPEYIDQLPSDWKLFMLGAMQHHWEESWISWYSDNLYHCHGSSIASHAVAIDKRVFLQLLYYAEKKDLPIDEGAVFHIQSVYDDDCFVFYPNLIIQDNTESDINSSALSSEDTIKKNNPFRWDYDNYES